MPDQQHISFFIPAHNCASTIEEAAESIINGNFSSGDEIIIVNDCSADNTGAVLDRLKEKYPELKIINHLRNKGGATARNTAVENSVNDLLFCLDSDNVLAPGSIAPLKTYLLEMNADVASFQYQHFFDKDKQNPAYIWHLPEGIFAPDDYYTGKNTPGQHGNYLFTKSSWAKAKGYADGAASIDTWSFGLRQAITGAKMVVLKDSFYYHRLSADSYWMRDMETRLWSVSQKAAYALYPFYERIDEDFLDYMLGDGRYTWYYELKKKPLKIVQPGEKNDYYYALQQKVYKIAYPKPGIIARAINKLKRMLGLKNWNN